MWRCNMCGKTFDEPDVEETTYESYYDAPISSHTPVTIYTCPYCNDEDIDEFDEEEEEEEEDADN